jgi:hypothetical protein
MGLDQYLYASNYLAGGEWREQEEQDASENMDQDDDLMNLDQNANQGFDQEQLTAEERDATIIKTLTANNP